jgi:hypothetical protein
MLQRKLVFAIFTFVIAVSVPLSRSHAVAGGGGLAGTIIDAKGDFVSNAAVMVVDPISNQKFTGVTDKQGRYKIEDLPAGVYSIIVSATGFDNVRRENVTVSDGQTVTFDARLSVAAVEATVSVKANGSGSNGAKANADPVYQQLRQAANASDVFAGSVAAVNNLVLKRDAATFTLRSGELYFIAPINGRVTGAVFLGEGELNLEPPNAREKASLNIFTGTQTLAEQFSQLVLRFTDKTYDEIKASPNAAMHESGGAQASHARDVYRDNQTLLRKILRTNAEERALNDLYAPKRPGYFTAFINGRRYNKLVYQIDPLGIDAVSPDQVALFSYGDTDGGVWTSFPLEIERNALGGVVTGTRAADNRIFDITHHEIDVVIRGAQITASDQLTFLALSGRRVLPFNLYQSLRVSRVQDEAGRDLDFIQENKNEDADFAVVLPQPMKTGKVYKIIVQYAGGDALRDLGGGNYFLIPRETWYPNNGGTRFGDRAIFDMTFHYPTKNTLIGTGTLAAPETQDGDAKVAKWTSGTTELAVAGFNYGKFKKKELTDKDTGYNVEIYVNTQLAPDLQRRDTFEKMRDAEAAASGGNILSETIPSASSSTTSGTGAALADTQNALRIYDAYFGKLPYSRVAMTQQPAGFFGQAWPTLIYMPYTAFLDQTQRVSLMGGRGGADTFWQYVGAHELAHQWWGHVIGWTSYREQWMSEGFAEFSASLYVQQTRGVSKLIDFWEDQRRMIVEPQPATKGRKPYTLAAVTDGYRANSAKTGSVARFLIYPKGAYILHMLRMMMYDQRSKDPDARFKTMMQDFVKTYYNQDVSTEDFKRIVDKHITPEMDLAQNKRMDWFFNEWVYGKEVPAYTFDYQIGSTDGKTTLTGRITQAGVSDNFGMRVPVWADFGKGWTRLGAAKVIGNTSVELPPVSLPQTPKRVAICALNDVLAISITNNKR